MKEQITLFFIALEFFTRIPRPSFIPYSEERLNRASRYFSLVGIVVGLVAAVVFWLALFAFSKPVAILISMCATILITGGFHEDGFSDCCDGFGGGMNRQQILDIMKDSRTGVFGVVGIVMMLALKFSVLYEIPEGLIPSALIAGHSISRFFAGSFIYTHDYVSESTQSKSKPLAREMTGGDLAVSSIFGIVPIFFMNSCMVFILLVPLIMIKWLFGRYIVNKIGGYTGDCLGAAQQICEVIFYMGINCLLWKYI